MGGFGSGRPAGRSTVEGCRSLKLDVNRVVRTLRGKVSALQGDQTVAAGWRASWPLGGGAPEGELKVYLALGREYGQAHLSFDIEHLSHRTGQRNQCVELESTPCHFGGVRWWWVCPVSGRRCAKLYLPNGGSLFASRGPGAYQLSYASQNATAITCSHWRIARIHQRLGDEYVSLPDTPPRKPKWMRYRTYDRLVAEWKTAMERHDAIFLAGSERLFNLALGYA